jgi:outer membrane protein assembly factor BamA
LRRPVADASIGGLRRLACLFLAAAAVAACGEHAAAHRPGEEYVAAIRLVGNHAIDDETLTEGLELDRRFEAGRGVDDYQLTIDTTRIAGAYQRRGYFTVQVTPTITRVGDAVTVHFTIVEGPRATTHVELSGLPAEVSAAKARGLIALADGAPFDYAAYDDAKAPLLALLEDAGYAHARLDAGVIADRAHALATARYVVTPGVPCTFGKIEITGATGALADAVRERLPFHEGDRYATSPLATAQTAIYGLGRFATARVDAERDTAATVIPVKVAVTEANRHELRLGGGLGLDPLNYAVRGRLQYTQLGWPFALSTVGLDVKPAMTVLRDGCTLTQLLDCPREPVARLIGTLSQLDLFRRDVKGELEGGLDYLTLEAYRVEGLYGRLGLSTPLGTPRVQLRVGWLLGLYRFAHVSPAVDAAAAATLGIDHLERLGELRQALIVDLRDHPIEPRWGAYAELRLAEGGAYAGGAYDFIQLTPELRAFAPLGPTVLAARLRVGVIAGDVPPTERYYAGGAASDRGYPERQMSPITTNAATGATVVVGGAGLVETGAELRVPLGRPQGLQLGGVAFVDGGDLEASASQLSATRLHWAAGLGLRWFFLPLGPIRLDFAYRLGADSAALPALGRFQWFLSIGEAY